MRTKAHESTRYPRQVTCDHATCDFCPRLQDKCHILILRIASWERALTDWSKDALALCLVEIIITCSISLHKLELEFFHAMFSIYTYSFRPKPLLSNPTAQVLRTAGKQNVAFIRTLSGNDSSLTTFSAAIRGSASWWGQWASPATFPISTTSLTKTCMSLAARAKLVWSVGEKP